jgi:hypothetical protein
MNAQDLFGVLVRAIGLNILLYGLWMFAGAVYPGELYSRTEFVATGTGLVCAGIILIRVADSVVRFAYATGPEDDEAPTEPDSN